MLYNSKARHSAHHDREDRDGDHDHHHKNVGLGWYVGFIVGEVRQEGDWALDIDYEDVQPFAVMDCDVSSDNAGEVLAAAAECVVETQLTTEAGDVKAFMPSQTT